MRTPLKSSTYQKCFLHRTIEWCSIHALSVVAEFLFCCRTCCVYFSKLSLDFTNCFEWSKNMFLLFCNFTWASLQWGFVSMHITYYGYVTVNMWPIKKIIVSYMSVQAQLSGLFWIRSHMLVRCYLLLHRIWIHLQTVVNFHLLPIKWAL